MYSSIVRVDLNLLHSYEYIVFAAFCNRGPRIHLSAISVKREREAANSSAYTALVHAVPAAHRRRGPNIQFATAPRPLYRVLDDSRCSPRARRMPRPPRPQTQRDI